MLSADLLNGRCSLGDLNLPNNVVLESYWAATGSVHCEDESTGLGGFKGQLSEEVASIPEYHPDEAACKIRRQGSGGGSKLGNPILGS